MDKVSGDLNKVTQACNAVQENVGKLIENAISQALAKPQDCKPTEINPRESRAFRSNWTS